MTSEITEEKYDDDEEEEPTCFIDTEAQKQRVRRIIEYQKELYRSSSSSSASCSTFSASHSSSLFNLMKRGSTSLRRLFAMEHTSLATHFDHYSGSPLIKPIPLWGGDSDQENHIDPWSSIKQYRPTNDTEIDDGRNKSASDGNFLDGNFGSVKTKVRIGKRKLTRKKSFRRLPGFGFWRFRGFRFRLRLIRRLKIVIFGRKKKL